MTQRALVLGGGGPVGIAWESGLIAGLESGGVRLGDAELIIGTSAGSVVGAQLALGSSGAELADAQRQQSARAPTADVSRAAGGSTSNAAPDLSGLMKMMASRPANGGAAELQDWRAGLGAWALQAKTIAAATFIESFGRIAATPWPTRDYRCTAIDAVSGAFKVWQREDHVQLGAAVASSCAVPGIYPCIGIAGNRYYDGGLRSATNADLAAGADVVVVISVMAASALMPAGAANPLEAEMATLASARSGSTPVPRVQLIVADSASQTAFGPNLMDARRRVGALDAGFAQGQALAAHMRGFW